MFISYYRYNQVAKSFKGNIFYQTDRWFICILPKGCGGVDIKKFNPIYSVTDKLISVYSIQQSFSSQFQFGFVASVIYNSKKPTEIQN